MDQAVSRNGSANEEVKDIPLSLIAFNPVNARKFEENMSPERQAAFDDLVESIRLHGLISPINVRPSDDGYMLIAGERRFRAVKRIAEMDGREGMTIRSIVKAVDDDEAFALMTAENRNREQLSPYEEAVSLKDELDRKGNTEDAILDISSRTGMPRHVILHKVALLSLPKEVMEFWQKGDITQAHVEQFSCVEGRERILKLLTECVRSRLTVKELRDAIFKETPDLSTAKFNTDNCKHCPHNTGLQSSLFGDSADAKCLSPSCYQDRQSEYFTDNWQSSKAKAVLKTNGFVFKHRLAPGKYEVVRTEARERCTTCDAFVSVVTLSGQIHKGEERICTGSKDCFSDLYVPKKTTRESAKKAKVEQEEVTGKGQDSKAKDGMGKNPAGGKPGKNTKDADEQAKKRSERRGLLHREKFFEGILPERMVSLRAGSPESIRTVLIALILSKPETMRCFGEKYGLGMTCRKEEAVRKILGLDNAELLPLLQELAVTSIMDGCSKEETSCCSSFSSSPGVRLLIADELLGVDLKAEWTPTEEYLKSMQKDELVAYGEEVGIWTEEKAVEYKTKNYAKKALMSLKNSELAGIILKSGVELKGRTPGEILSSRGK